MKLIEIDKDTDKNTFRITEDDRLWVEENFKWLTQVFGYPGKHQPQVLFTPAFFPQAFGSEIAIDNLVADLCILLDLEKELIKAELITDLRNADNIAYETYRCDTQRRAGQYHIHIAHNMLKRPEVLVPALVYELVRIRLTESGIEYDSGGDDTSLFIYLAAIYYGFGIILSQNMEVPGQKPDEQWEIRWEYTAKMPAPVMAFSLATYTNLTGDENGEWKNEMPAGFRTLYEQAVAYIRKYPGSLYDEREVMASTLFDEADDAFERNDFDLAISTLQKILFLTSDDHMKTDVYNNMGYYYLRQGDYAKSISLFQKALSLGSEFGYANDNLGYALIMSGQLTEGRKYLEKAQQTKNNDPAYSYRNMALYHFRNNDPALAETYFQKAFRENTPVDLLAYHYAEFLLAIGEKEKALDYLRQAVDKNEPEAKRLWASLHISDGQ
jgi:Tfp pilus assembly protein PilF